MADQRKPAVASSRLARKAESVRSVGAWTALPTMMVIGLLGGYFAGAWLEGRYGYAPWLGFGGMVLGGAASVRKVVQAVQSEQRRQKQARDHDRATNPRF